MGSWDQGVDFEFMYEKLLRMMRRAKRDTQYCYSAILLIQLRNGSRISEAVRAFKEYVKTGKQELEVPVSKKVKPETRLMVVPDGIDRSRCVEYADIDEKKLTDRVKVFAKRELGVNTHSLRYAFITYLLKHGVNPSIIAKITRHSKLDFILTYTQEKAARSILRGL